MTSRYLLFVFFLLFAGVNRVTAGGTTATATDLWRQCEQARSLCRYDSLAVHAGQLLALARRQGNRRDEAYALFYQGLAQLFTGSRGAMAQLGEARDLAEEIDNDSVLALVTNAMGIYHAMNENNTFVAQQFFFRSLDYAEQAHYEQMWGRVYGNLLILTHTASDSVGLSYARYIYDEGRRQRDYEQTFMGAYYQANYYNVTGDNIRAEAFLREALNLYREHPYDDVASVYTLYSKVKMDMGDLTSAERYAQQAVHLADSLHQPFILPDTYLQYAVVLSRKGQAQQSNVMAYKALDAAGKASGRTKIVECYRLIADNSRQLGQTAMAMDYLERANKMMDTLAQVNMERLNHERTIMLDIQKKEREAQRRKQQMADQRRMNIVLVVAVLLLSVLLAVIALLYRHRNRLYKNIVQQNAHAVARQKELRQRIDRLSDRLEEFTQKAGNDGASGCQGEPVESEKPVESDPGRPGTLVSNDEKMQELYDRACRLMEHDRLFTDPQLNRERLAELLGTNRTYLSTIIKEKCGMSYLQFVNSYRINEAIRILSDPEKTDYPLKQIWSDLGFNSPATFYKLFQQAVGITPSVYRKQFIEIKGGENRED